MKIAFFIKSFYGGGAERVVINLANELVKNHDVFVIVADKSGHYTSNVSSEVEIIELKRASIRQIIFDLPNLSKKYSFDVLISNLVHENIFASIGWLFCKRSFPLVKVEHNKISAEMDVGTRIKILITKLMWRLTKNIGTQTVGVSQGVCDDLKARGVKFVQKIYNPILTANDIQEKKADTNRDNDRLLFVGRLVEQKNPLMAVRILKNLRERGGCQTLTIAGEGPLECIIKEHVKRYGLEKYVNMLGFVEDISSLYFDHQFLLLTSEFEGFGNVIVEASYRGCIPISRDIEFGPSEIISNPDIGILLPKNAAEIDFAKIIESYDSAADRNRIRSELEGRFSVSKISEQYQNIIRDIKI
ncbi:glycosyltransferase [Lentibacter algarum]|uniref:glycosyltransferase n=1 Tax=Lentibacter algarum TaxID=576131 RepID=UPI0024927A0F|nr:glycosyltransferase [Lentibacter algarum]